MEERRGSVQLYNSSIKFFFLRASAILQSFFFQEEFILYRLDGGTGIKKTEHDINKYVSGRERHQQGLSGHVY
jgi:hypothetical protein